MKEYNLKDYTNAIIVAVLITTLVIEICLLCFMVLSSTLVTHVITNTHDYYQLQQDAIEQISTVHSDQVQDSKSTTITDTSVTQTPSDYQSEDEKRAKEYAENNPGETLALIN